MDSLLIKLVNLKTAIQALVDENNRLVAENRLLNSIVEEARKEIEFQKNIQNPEKIVKIAALFHNTEKKLLSKQLGEMIKSIDQSIALMEHDSVKTTDK